ncbi:hypothetical protein, partial [Bradyrhizobium guangdongense]|uniref:hypothetical protein n=2 Tax=Nitrobacteraceae TaxID=41294 RepID=UPI00131A22FA
MIIPTHFGPAGPLWRSQPFQIQAWRAWAFSCFVSLDSTVVDLRLALATAVTRSLVHAADALVRHVMGR